MEITDKQIIAAIKGQRERFAIGLIGENRIEEEHARKKENIDNNQIIEAIKGRWRTEGFITEFQGREKDVSTSNDLNELLNKNELPAGNKKVEMVLAENMINSSDLEDSLLLESIVELREGAGLLIMGTIVQGNTMSVNRNYYPESTLIQSVKDKVWEGGKIFYNHWSRVKGNIKNLIGKIKKVFYDPAEQKLKFEAFISKDKTDHEIYKAIKDKLLDISMAAKGYTEKAKDSKGDYRLVNKIAPGASFDIITEPPAAVGAGIEHTEEKEEIQL